MSARPLANDAVLAATIGWIAAVQTPSGFIPWFSGGHGDPWNHVEAAMALSAGGAGRSAERAFDWLKGAQLDSGAWHNYYLPDGSVEEPRIDTNVCAYVATGVWHHYLGSGDRGFLEDMWPTVRRAVDFVLAWQRPGGELVWSIAADGTPANFGLLAASASAYLSVRCAIAAAGELGLERPEWQLAAGHLRRAVVAGSPGFADKGRFAMDWYYPVLAGALLPEAALARLEARWSEFVIEGKGVRCVADKVWVTAAETAECAIALLSLGRHCEAGDLLASTERHRCADGSYVTGLVYPQLVSYPQGERSTYSAAAVVLAADAGLGSGATAQVFGGGCLPRGLEPGPAGELPVRLSTRRLPVAREDSSVNSPERRAKL